MSDLNRWMQKHNLCPENILYLYRSDRKTVLHRMDGGEAALYAPMHSGLSVLPEDQFLNISKGIAVNAARSLTSATMAFIPCRTAARFRDASAA